MININNYILEKLHIGKDIKIDRVNTDERYEAIIKYVDDYMKSLIPDIEKHRKIGRREGAYGGKRGFFIYVYKWKGISIDEFNKFYNAVDKHVSKTEEVFDFVTYAAATATLDKSQIYIRFNYETN